MLPQKLLEVLEAIRDAETRRELNEALRRLKAEERAKLARDIQDANERIKLAEYLR